jgi:hypothetical protein
MLSTVDPKAKEDPESDRDKAFGYHHHLKAPGKENIIREWPYAIRKLGLDNPVDEPEHTFRQSRIQLPEDLTQA